MSHLSCGSHIYTPLRPETLTSEALLPPHDLWASKARGVAWGMGVGCLAQLVLS